MEVDDYDFEGDITTTLSTEINSTNITVSTLVNNVTTKIPFLPLGLGIIIVTVLGIVGNVISAVVLSRKRLRSSYSVLTLGLAIVDTIYLVTKLLRYGVASALEHNETGLEYLNVILPTAGPYLRALTFTAHTASTYFTIAIAVDRYITVCRFSSGGKFSTRRFARFTSLVVVIWSFVFNATRWLEFETVLVQNASDEPIYEMKTTELRRDPLYREIYIFWIYFIFMFAIPFVSLSILNLKIMLGIREMIMSGSPLTNTQRRDTSFSIMLIGVVLVFLICNVDYLILDILEYAGIEFSQFWNHLGNFLLTLNSAVNFIIYCVFGWKFRQELWSLIRDICPCLKQHGSHDIVVTDESQWVKDTMDQHVMLQTIPRATLSKVTTKTTNVRSS